MTVSGASNLPRDRINANTSRLLYLVSVLVCCSASLPADLFAFATDTYTGVLLERTTTGAVFQRMENVQVPAEKLSRLLKRLAPQAATSCSSRSRNALPPLDQTFALKPFT